ncbi:MAG: 30S ribosomal protein S6 [Acidobacteriota bacterium]
MRTYEVLFILSPQIPEEESTSLIADFKGIGETGGATLVNEEAWGRRRLAYPIEKFNEGIYHLFIFHSEAALSELDRKMRNSDRIIRHLIVRTDLETRRAIKLAKKNPKKERVRPSPSASSGYSAPSAGSTAPAAVAPPAEVSAEAATTASETTTTETAGTAPAASTENA